MREIEKISDFVFKRLEREVRMGIDNIHKEGYLE
jgi:hypothetical protein